MEIKKHKMYISGKITGLDYKAAFELFDAAEKVLNAIGHDVVNPMKLLEPQPHLTWKDYMVEDIKAIFNCTGMYMLSNWRESSGARIEHAIAIETKMKVFYQ